MTQSCTVGSTVKESCCCFQSTFRSSNTVSCSTSCRLFWAFISFMQRTNSTIPQGKFANQSEFISVHKCFSPNLSFACSESATSDLTVKIRPWFPTREQQFGDQTTFSGVLTVRSEICHISISGLLGLLTLSMCHICCAPHWDNFHQVNLYPFRTYNGFTADTLSYPVTLTFGHLILNVCSV